MRNLTIFLAAASVFLAGSAVVGITVKKLRKESDGTLQERIDLIAGQTALRLEEFLESRLVAVQVVQQGMARGLLEESHRFTSHSRALQLEFEGFQALNWIDDDYVLTWVVPEETNRGAAGKSVLENPVAARAMLEAERTAYAVLSDPIDLFQGGRGIASYYPVFETLPEGKSLRGFVNGVFRITPMVESAIGGIVSGRYGVELRTTSGDEIYFSTEQEHAPTEGIHDDGPEGMPFHGHGTVHVLHQRWPLILWPTDEMLVELGRDRHFSFLVGGISLNLALGLGIGLFLLARREEERRRVERAQLQERAAQARKMEAVGQLAGGVAHDFNNLLTAITGSASLASFDVESESPAAKHLERILKACRRAADMTARLLSFSRTSATEVGRCPVTSELEALHDLLQPLVREDIKLDYRIAKDLEDVPLSASELGQVVFNLVANAIDAMPSGGTLHVQAQAVEVDHEERPGPWVEITVRDHGDGMTEEVKARLFDPFFTTKGAGEGTGLGLSTVYGIVRRAKGAVAVTSKLGVGTEMRVFLPQLPHLSEADSEMSPGLPPDARRGRILVVEDEPKVREVAVSMLEEAGYRVTYTTNGAAALDLIEQDPEFDLVFTDVVMPQLGGLELARILRERGFPGGILLCSGYATGLSRDELDRLDANFLAKPYAHNRLLEAVARGVEAAQ